MLERGISLPDRGDRSKVMSALLTDARKRLAPGETFQIVSHGGKLAWVQNPRGWRARALVIERVVA